MTCLHCSTDQYTAERGDILRAAHALLHSLEWPAGVELTPVDIVECARYLAGDDLS